VNKPPFWLVCAIAAANILAVLEMPYGYYQFLRLIVTGYAAYVSYVYFRRGPSHWGWAFGTVALLYNPLFLVTMSKEFHTLVNFIVAGLVVFEFYRLRDIEQPSVSAPEGNEMPQGHPLIEQPAQTKLSSGEIFRIVFPPLFALAVGVVSLAALSFVKSRQSEEAFDGEIPESSRAEIPFETDASLPSDELPMQNRSSEAASSNGVVPTLGAFTEKVDVAVREFIRIYKTDGLSGAEAYSRNCQNAAQKSNDILDTDFCTAFDMTAALVDHSEAKDLSMPLDEYFKARAIALDSDYARFSQASKNRTELIWQEVKATLPLSMQELGN
jgi:hypothetical protein